MTINTKSVTKNRRRWIMAAAFSENEKIIIRAKLHSAAERCLKIYGVRKTTVEQLAKMSGISKGAFYLFYKSKEILFFEVIESFQGRIFDSLISDLKNVNSSKKQTFIDAVFELYKNTKDSFILTIIQNNDIEYLFRKLPPEQIVQHHSFDDMMTVKLFEALDIEAQNAEIVSAAMRAIFMTILHEKEIGIHYIQALKMLIIGVANQIMEEDLNDRN